MEQVRQGGADQDRWERQGLLDFNCEPQHPGFSHLGTFQGVQQWKGVAGSASNIPLLLFGYNENLKKKGQVQQNTTKLGLPQPSHASLSPTSSVTDSHTISTPFECDRNLSSERLGHNYYWPLTCSHACLLVDKHLSLN